MNHSNDPREAISFRDVYLSEDYVSILIQHNENITNELKDIDYAYTYKV